MFHNKRSKLDHNYDHKYNDNHDQNYDNNYDDDGHHTVYQVRCPCLCQLPNRNSRTGDLLENIKKLPIKNSTKYKILNSKQF